MKRLLVIIPDRLSDLIDKGEITARYYNPGELFDEVHIMMTSDDNPDPALLQKTVGDAKLYLHNLPTGKELFVKSFGWRPALLSRWAKRGVMTAHRIKPELIRCYGNHLNGYLAAKTKMALGLPYVISLHTHPKENRLKWSISLREKLINYTAITIENIAVRHADIVVPVYESIQSYLRSYKINDYEIIYNIVNPESIEVKYKYELNSPVKVISVGRLIPGKCPDNIIRSIKELEVEFDIVGDGPLRGYLQQVAKDLKIADRVNFIPSIPNDELCRRLGDYDIFAIHSGYHGVPKTVLEASLTGLPIIISKRKGGPVPEFEGDWLMLVDNSMEGYQRALEKLISNHDFRENLGRRAYTYAQQNWEPTKMENRYVEVYKRVMEEAGVQA